MDQDQKHSKPEQQPGVGRTFNRGPQQDEHQGTAGSGRADISSMDQQEGQMHHGETGGSGHLGTKQDEGGAGKEGQKV